MRYLILHGYEGNGPDHWQTWLAGRLRDDGHDVAYPDLPDPFAPDLAAWLRVLDGERRDGDVVVCHSLGCCLWLHHRAAGGPPALRALLVAPPCPDSGIAELAPFFPVPVSAELGAEARLVISDDDPYCRAGAHTHFAGLGAPVDVLPGAAHVNPESGFGPWDGALAWCQGAKNGVLA